MRSKSPGAYNAKYFLVLCDSSTFMYIFYVMLFFLFKKIAEDNTSCDVNNFNENKCFYVKAFVRLIIEIAMSHFFCGLYTICNTSQKALYSLINYS